MGLRILVLVLAMMFACGGAASAEDTPPLAQSPTLNRTHVVFAWGGYLWSVAREGGETFRGVFIGEFCYDFFTCTKPERVIADMNSLIDLADEVHLDAAGV